jgi:preprotein translocase subunit SecG
MQKAIGSGNLLKDIVRQAVCGWPRTRVRGNPKVLHVLVALETILGLGVLLLIFLHSGKGSGLATTFGGSGAFGGSGVVQKNLDRLTVACSIAFFIVAIALAYMV